jgi:hypothetical protein
LQGARETVALSDNSPRKAGRAAGYGYAVHALGETQHTHFGHLTLRQIFPDLLPLKPYCADCLSDGLQIRSKSVALTRRHIQLNGPAAYRWIVHDVDRPDAYFADRDALLPPPNVIAINPENGHGHIAYLLASPVARHSMARLEPLRFYAAVERGMARRLDADRCYTGLIAKNPMHACWRVEWRRNEPYTLCELEGWLFATDMRPNPTPPKTWGAGRNVTVFDELRAVAYREVRKFKADGQAFECWFDRCLKVAQGLNSQFPQPLNLSEVRAIARSVARWTWRNFSVEKFIARQRHLAKRGNAKRWGNSSAEKLQPWKAIGVSRATYYRWKAVEAVERSAVRAAA